MNNEERFKSIINGYSRKSIPPFTIQEYALIEYEKFCLDIIQENKQLKNNWNKLKKYVNKVGVGRPFVDGNGYVQIEDKMVYVDDVLEEMQELEKGDDNEK